MRISSSSIIIDAVKIIARAILTGIAFNESKVASGIICFQHFTRQMFADHFHFHEILSKILIKWLILC